MSPSMDRDEIHELAAGYALGALDESERRRFEALLDADDPEARAALREFEEVMTGVASQLREPPPPSVKQALMARVSADEPTARRRVVPLPESPRRRVRWAVAWVGAVAAGLAAVVVGLAVSARYEERLATLGREAVALQQELRSQQAVVAILRDPATQMVALAGQPPSPEARGRMMWHATQGGLFVAAGLPAAPRGKAYQLWAIAGRNAPVSAGVFVPDGRGVGSLRVPPLAGVSRVDVFAVTLEPAGGLPAPSGPIYLAGKV